MKNDFIKSFKRRRLKFVKDYHIQSKLQIFIKVVNSYIQSFKN